MRVQRYARSVLLFASFAASLAAPAGSAAWAQSPWRPEKTVEIIVPTGAAGINDSNARLIQKTLMEQKVITVPALVINKPGGNQSLAVVYLNQHAADWKHQLTENNLESRFMRGKELSRWLDAEYAATRAVMADIGIVK